MEANPLAVATAVPVEANPVVVKTLVVHPWVEEYSQAFPNMVLEDMILMLEKDWTVNKQLNI